MIYYVDKLSGERDDGLYINVLPKSIILIREKVPNRIGIIVHEICHHVEVDVYSHKDNWNEIPAHGYYYKLAKERMITWLRNNISKDVNWYPCFKAILKYEDMIKFKL